MTKTLVLYSTDARAGAEGARPSQVVTCDGYTVVGDRLVIAQSPGHAPKIPFVNLEHQAIVLDIVPNVQDSIKPDVGIMRVNISMASLGDKPFSFWANQMLPQPSGIPIFGQPDDAKIRLVHLDPERVASLTHSDPITAEQLAEMEEAAELSDQDADADSGSEEE